MGAGIVSVIAIPTLSVISCAEIQKNAETNYYSAFSVPESALTTNGNISPTLLNEIALGLDGYKQGNLASAIDSSSDITSVTNWNFSKTGTMSSLGNLGFTDSLNKDNGVTSNLNAPDWLKQNNAIIVSQLFTSLLNYLVGPISLTNYLGQEVLEYSGSSSGMLRMLYGSSQTSSSKSIENDFINSLLHITQSSNETTTYYLYPTDIFYSVSKSNINTATYWNSQNPTNSSSASNSVNKTDMATSTSSTSTSNSGSSTSGTTNSQNSGSSGSVVNYSSLLASYMPLTPSSNAENKTQVSNGKSVKYDNDISVAEISNIQIVFEYYCSSSSTKDQTSTVPINCTQTQNFSNDDISYPYFSPDKNPYYQKYFVLNINPIDVTLQNIGLGTSSSKTSSSSSSSKSSKTQDVNLDNYAALNYYGSLNELNYYQQGNTNYNIQYNEISSNGQELISSHPSYSSSASQNYLEYWQTAAASWCFNSSSINTLYQLQQEINKQANLFYTIASLPNIHESLTSSQQAIIKSYLDGDIENQTQY